MLSSKKNKKEKRLPFLAAFFYIRNQRGRYNCQGEMGQNDRLSLRNSSGVIPVIRLNTAMK